MAKTTQTAAGEQVRVKMTALFSYPIGSSAKRVLPAGWIGPVSSEIADQIEAEGKGGRLPVGTNASEDGASGGSEADTGAPGAQGADDGTTDAKGDDGATDVSVAADANTEVASAAPDEGEAEQADAADTDIGKASKAVTGVGAGKAKA